MQSHPTQALGSFPADAMTARSAWLRKYDEHLEALITAHGKPSPITAEDLDGAAKHLHPSRRQGDVYAEFSYGLECHWSGQPVSSGFVGVLTVEVPEPASVLDIREAIMRAALELTASASFDDDDMEDAHSTAAIDYENQWFTLSDGLVVLATV